jgi:hypothetical protein
MIVILEYRLAVLSCFDGAVMLRMLLSEGQGYKHVFISEDTGPHAKPKLIQIKRTFSQSRHVPTGMPHKDSLILNSTFHQLEKTQNDMAI